MDYLNKIHYMVSESKNWFLYLKHRKGPYLEYYKAVMRRTSKENSKESVGGHWEENGQMQFDRLIKFGLLPKHTLFELGCGMLRGGRHFIKYLDTGNYYGNDISKEILQEAKNIVIKEGLELKKPKLFLTNDIEFSEVTGNTFDFIHAQSVLSHMPPEDIITLFKNINKIMHSDSQFYASFFLSANGTMYTSRNKINFFYPLDWLIQKGSEFKLNVEFVDTDHKQKMLKITKG